MRELSGTSLQLLCKKYLRPDSTVRECSLCGVAHETLGAFWNRVSFGEAKYQTYLENLDFLPNSPALYSAGTDSKGTLSACFKFDVEDTLESIMAVACKAAVVLKWGGGVGYCLSAVRPKGAPISSTHGKACGPVNCLYLYQVVADPLITQGGRRRGAQMAVLHCEHPDIWEFVNCKDKGETLDTFNLSVAVTDKFMRAATDLESAEGKLFEGIVKHAWECGDPGLFFIDEAERHNPTPHLGRLTGVNACGEVPLLDNEACNLCSINLSNFVVEGRVDFDRLSSVAYIAAEYLDAILDHNRYPVPEVAAAVGATRKIGLGVMGWADMLALLRTPYDGQEAVDVGGAVMSCVRDAGVRASIDMGTRKGPYSAARESSGMNRRNATVTCIAPTGSRSTIADCSSGIEPHYALEYTLVMGDGTPLKRRVRVLDLCSPFVPKTAHEVGWRWHVSHQAEFQKYVDLAVSKTINMPASATLEDVRGAFMESWHRKCKGITVYRDGSKNRQALYKEGSVPQFHRRKLPVDVPTLRHRFTVGGVEGFMHVGTYPDDGSLGEVFLTVSKMGSTVDGMMDALAIMLSVAVQHGVPLEVFVEKLVGRRFEPSGLTDDKAIPAATSLVDYVFRYLARRFLDSHSISYDSGMQCPECGASVISQEGCLHCRESCGWSRC